MIEYPSIINSSKAPRDHCIAFEKLDGSNIRVKYTDKQGFCLFGSRTQLIDETHPHLGEVVGIFKKNFDSILTDMVKKNWPNERELIFYGEFFGKQSFAGIHVAGDPKELVIFDVLVGHKNRKFLLPQEFVKMFNNKIRIPRVIYEGNMSDELIKDVKEGKYEVDEGVVCKGHSRSGAFRGNVWMCKIKTQAYLKKVFDRFGDDGLKKFGE